MTLDDLGNLGEIVSALGVVASLIYLALQIRQNTAQIRQNTNSVLGGVELQTTLHHSDWLASVAQSPELARVWRLGMSAQAPLAEEEEVQFAMLLGSAFYGIEGVFRQYTRGLLSEDSWEPMENLIVRYMRSRVVLQWWANRDVPFSGSFSRYVESKIEGEPGADRSSIWSEPSA